MNALKWTTKKPTKPGWYWYRYSENHKPYICDVWLDVEKNLRCIFGVGYLVKETPFEWAGPIPEPKENQPK